jgi:murein L,D-transpeptidase YafK
MMSRMLARLAAVALVAGSLAACGEDTSQWQTSSSRHWVPLSPEILALMQEKGMSKSDPILIRTYKQEAEFEVWKKAPNGEYALLKTFPMCRWSGQLGPKRKEGDRQAPEGYYSITPAQLNPNSHYHLSYDVGYPNAYDRAHGGTGSYIMVHGDCSSAGCFSMTDKQIEDIYALVREAQSGGQKEVQMESFPFRFTPANMARHRLSPNMPFWKNLKEGADRFELTHQEPKVGVCQGRYTFDRANGGCGPDANPALTKEVAEKERQDAAKVAALVGKGAPAIRLAYDDGGQNPYFKNKVTETSRPEAIAAGPLVELLDAKGKPTQRAERADGFDDKAIDVAVADIAAAPKEPQAVASQRAPVAAAATTLAQRASHAAAADPRKAVSAFAAPETASIPAPSSQDQPFYRRFLAKLPFSGGAQGAAAPDAGGFPGAVIDPNAPLPPARPTSFDRSASRRAAAPQASLGSPHERFATRAIFTALPRPGQAAAVTSQQDR